MKIINILFALVIFASFGFAQDSANSFDGNQKHKITFDRGFFTNDYTVDGKEVDVDVVENLLLYVPEANSKWSTGNTLRYVSWGIDFIGGFFIGYSIIQSQSPYEEDINSYKTKLALGAGILIVGLILEKVGNSKKDGAIELYNSQSGMQSQQQNSDASETSTSYNLQIVPTSQGGIGLAFNF